MLKRCGFLATFAALALALQAQVSQAVTIAQIDDFQNGTTMGWTVGSGSNPNPPANVADVGPGGTGDNALQLTATGTTGTGSKLVSFNSVQWAGDYTGAGVTAVSMALNNSGSTVLDIRLAIDGAGGIIVTTSAVTLAPGIRISSPSRRPIGRMPSEELT